MSDYGRIRRGPMAADRFTQISNQLFRDTRLSFKAKGVFGLISTHRNGYGVTPEAIAAQSTDGVSAVKGALRELEAADYLKRTRVRRKDGTYGPSQYFITDMPEIPDDEEGEQEEQQTPRSEPAVDFPPVDFPPVDEPPVEKTPHKKTSSKNTSLKNTLSPAAAPEPPPTAEPAPGDAERETTAAPHDKPADEAAARVVDAYARQLGRPILATTRTALTRQAASLLANGLPLPWLQERARELADRGWTNLALHCERSTAPTTTPQPGGLPPHCGQKGCDMHVRMVKDHDRDGELVPCPECHPRSVAARRHAETGAAA